MTEGSAWEWAFTFVSYIIDLIPFLSDLSNRLLFFDIPSNEALFGETVKNQGTEEQVKLYKDDIE